MVDSSENVSPRKTDGLERKIITIYKFPLEISEKQTKNERARNELISLKELKMREGKNG